MEKITMKNFDKTFASQFAGAWISAWNSHDLDRVLEHYEEDFIFTSPMINSVTGEPSGRLQGKSAVRAYWSQALSRLPNLHFELLDTLLGAGNLTLYYRGHRGFVAETFFFSEGHKVAQAAATYSIAP